MHYCSDFFVIGALNNKCVTNDDNELTIMMMTIEFQLCIGGHLSSWTCYSSLKFDDAVHFVITKSVAV